MSGMFFLQWIQGYTDARGMYIIALPIIFKCLA
jgi:hypothetical protein